MEENPVSCGCCIRKRINEHITETGKECGRRNGRM
jgi:hypothetical protein